MNYSKEFLSDLYSLTGEKLTDFARIFVAGQGKNPQEYREYFKDF